MTIYKTEEIEIGDDYIDVEFFGDTEWYDASFSYSYGSIDATQKYDPVLYIENIEWNKSEYTDDTNAAIGAFLLKYYKAIEKDMCAEAYDTMYDY